MDYSSIITALITAAATIVAVIIKSNENRRSINEVKYNSELHFIRNEILTLITADKVDYGFNKLPVNYKTVLELFENYKNLNGNSYIHRVVDEYAAWVESISIEKGVPMPCGGGKKKSKK